MTMDEAIRKLEQQLNGNIPEDYPDTAKALQLGIEGLKRVKPERTVFTHYPKEPLPGETEE